MVDIEDDPEWSVADEIEEDDNDRLLLTFCVQLHTSRHK